MPDRSLLRVLILCTGNSARSQMAEALLATGGAGRLAVASAGTKPAARVNPFALQVLEERGVRWHGHAPRDVRTLEHEPWDVVITVCDHAKETCPVFPAATITAHWGMPDPAEAGGPGDARLRAFRDALAVIERRVSGFLALPFETMPAAELRERLRAIGATP